MNDPKGRRNFLKLMSASLALAGVGACTRQPPESIVPYVRQPEDLVPGRPLFFASAIPLGGVARPVLVESHMGRPTKIEGNPEHPASLGATDVLTQARRARALRPRSLADRRRIAARFGRGPPVRAAMQAALGPQKASQGAGLRILTEPITSPSLAELVATVLKDYPQAQWHQYDPVAGDGERLGLRQASGTAGNAIYHLDKADVVVSLDADFLGAGPAMVRYTHDFVDRRRVTKESTGMNRLYAVESSPTLTGVKAEHRLPLRASDIEGFCEESCGGRRRSPADRPARSEPARREVDRRRQPRTCRRIAAGRVVMAGDYQPAAVHALARAMNQALGNVGTTVTYGPAIEPNPISQHASLAELATAMDAGQVQVLVILGNNPVFTAPAELKFAERLGKVSLVVYLSLYLDETAEFAHWHIPEAHPLETWGDARAFDGTVTMMQPLIAPLYDAHSAHEVLATLTARPAARRSKS